MQTHRCREIVLGVLVALAATIGASGAVRAQDDVPDRKMARQVGVMEKILDQVLIESPNFLVPGRNNARGIYLEEFGVLLTFEASLVDKGGLGFDFKFDWGDLGYKIEENEKGDKVIVIPKKRNEEEQDGEESGSWQERRRRQEERLYERGKIEVRDLLLDYGDTLTGLRDDQWVAVAAFLKDSDFFADERISRLVIKARMKDLRELAARKISEEEALSRFVETEY